VQELIDFCKPEEKNIYGHSVFDAFKWVQKHGLRREIVYPFAGEKQDGKPKSIKQVIINKTFIFLTSIFFFSIFYSSLEKKGYKIERGSYYPSSRRKKDDGDRKKTARSGHARTS
jgi:hypothetical protein